MVDINRLGKRLYMDGTGGVGQETEFTLLRLSLGLGGDSAIDHGLGCASWQYL